MKTFKKILLVILLLVALLVIIAFFLPRQIHVERSTVIGTPAIVVFNQVNDLHNWDKWATWNQIDPDMKVEYIGTGIGEGAGYDWESENPQVGKGELIITASVPYDSIATSLNFMEEGTAGSYFTFEEQAGTTLTTWAFDTDLGYNPLARWFGLMFDSMIGADFEKGLESLKVVSETILQEKRPIVEIRDLPAVNVVSLREEINMDDIEMKMGMMFGKLMEFVEKRGLIMADAPLTIYHKVDEGLIDMECCIPVNELPEKPDDGIQAGNITAGKYVYTDHFGSYHQLMNTHKFVREWMEKRQLFPNGSPIEKYYTNPQIETDTAKWQTGILYPID